MPRVPYPDPLYPVVWADTPGAPDNSPTSVAVSGLPDDDDPFQLHLDEALVRKADNDTVDRWKALAGPWFDARGGDAASRWKDIEQSLNEIVRRPLGELDTVRQRNMYRDIMAPRLEAWGDEARAHAERETRAFNDAQSQQRQDLALGAMRRGAQLDDMRAVAEGERRLVGEVRGRSRQQGLDPDAASAAEAQALGAAHSDVVEHLARHDPRRAQDWLNAHSGMIGDLAKVDRLNRTLQPYVAEQQQEGLADQIRGEASDLSVQHAAVDAMGLDPVTARALKQRLADMTVRDRKATEAKQTAGPIRLSGGSQDGTRIPSPEYRAQPPHYEQLPDGRWVFGRYEGTPGSGEAHFQEYEDPDLAAWKDATTFAVDMAPALGSLKSADQIITGRDPVTGEPIDRSWEIAGLALGLVPAGKLVEKGARALARKLGSKPSFEEHVARFMAKGFTQKQAERLAKPYNGMGHHFMPRRWGLPKRLSDSSFNVLKPKGMTQGDFYELHFKVDPKFNHARMPKRLGPAWNGKRLGLKKYGRLGRLWHGSPRRLKAAVGGTAATGATGTYIYEESDDD